MFRFRGAGCSCFWGVMGSLGIVRPQVMRFTEPLPLKSGAQLPDYELAYET